MKRFAALLALIVALMAASASAQPPEPAICVYCLVVDNYDGDTLTAEIRMRVNVRLCGHEKGRECWAPELKDPGGKESKAHLAELSKGRFGTLYIPIKDARNVANLFSMGRVLGDVWIDGRQHSLSELQVSSGHASTKKNGQLGK